MFTKVLPVILWVLAWQLSLPFDNVLAQTSPAPITATKVVALTSPGVVAPLAAQPGPVAFDDYRMDVQAGVRIDSYNLAPLAEHDAARTQSMIDGIAGRGASHRPTDAGNEAFNTWHLLPRPAVFSLWLAGALALILMVVRSLRQGP